jgi:LmbE family N-acetylglucosaminyl deacetylase
MLLFTALTALVALTAALAAPRVLIVVAHPDDDCGFGALTYQLSHNLGFGVDLCVITDGAGGYRYSAAAEFLYDLQLTNETVARSKLGIIRQREEREGASYIGIDNISFLGQYDAFTTNATQALAWWDVPKVKSEIKALLDARRYDFVLTMLPGEGENHGAHKAATILALEVAIAHPTAPVVIAGPNLVSYVPLPDYPITAAPADPAVLLNRTTPFGFRDALDYRMVVSWAMGAHKSQGGEEMGLPSGPLSSAEHYWLFDANPPDAAAKVKSLFARLDETPFRYYKPASGLAPPRQRGTASSMFSFMRDELLRRTGLPMK